MKTAKIGRTEVAGKKPLICFPITVEDWDGLDAVCRYIGDAVPDLIEWRGDFFKHIEDEHERIKFLCCIRERLDGYPVIFTCRAFNEGGFRKIDEQYRIDIIKTTAGTGLVDAVDIELSSGQDSIDCVIEQCRRKNVSVIVSYHNFNKTPAVEEIVDILIKEQEAGADIGKVAVMPCNMKDVISLLDASLIFDERHDSIPAVTVSMSGKGTISRVAGFMFGSSITFSSGLTASAPGQLSVQELRTTMDVLKKHLHENK